MRAQRSSRLLVLLATGGALAAWAGCTAIAGIQNGELVDGGSGDDTTTAEGGGGPDGHIGEGGGGGPDGTVDGQADGKPTSDSPGAPVELRCAIVPGSTIVVDDLGTYDGSSQQFQGGVWITRTNANDTVYVIAQRSAEQAQFIGYQVSFSQQTSNPVAFTGLSNQIRLLDVQSVGTTNRALVGYFAGIAVEGTEDALQIVDLPYSTFGGSGWPLANSRFQSSVTSGRLLHQAQTDDWLATSHTTASFQQYYVRAGQGDTNDAGAGTVLTHSLTTNYDVSTAPLVTVGGTTYAFVDQGLADGGTAVFAYPSDVSDAGTAAGINVGGIIGAVVGAQVDPGNGANVELIAVNSTTGTSFQLWGGSVAPSTLTSLTIGSPPLTSGSTIAPLDAPFDRSCFQWMGPELLATGIPQDGSGGVVLLWVGPTGRAVSRATTSGKLVTTSNPITGTAVLGIGNIGEGAATIAVAWIERVTSDAGTKYDRLSAARVSCAPLPGGG